MYYLHTIHMYNTYICMYIRQDKIQNTPGTPTYLKHTLSRYIPTYLHMETLLMLMGRCMD